MSIANQVNYNQLDSGKIAERSRPLDSTGPFAIPLVSGVSSHLATTDEEELLQIDAQLGNRLYVTKIMVTNGDDTTGTWVELRAGAGGTVVWEGYAGAGGGGFVVDLSSEPLLLSTSLYVACADAGADVVVCAAGYIGQ